jgi:hypothetical protein
LSNALRGGNKRRVAHRFSMRNPNSKSGYRKVVQVRFLFWARYIKAVTHGVIVLFVRELQLRIEIALIYYVF